MLTRTTRGGLELSALSLGMAQFGNLYRETTDAEAAGAIEQAWAGGIRYFDTAPHYGLGLSERRAGRLLAEFPRDELIVSTKVGRLLVDNPEGAGRRDDEGFDVEASTRRQWDFSRDGVRRSLDASLERLGLDRVDIVYVHDPDEFADQAIDEAVPALIELREQGVVRAIGVGMNQSALPARFVRETDIDLVMLAGRYTLVEQGALGDLLPIALERGVDIVAAGVYNSGLLSAARPTADTKYDYGDAPIELIERARRIAEVCERFGVSLPEAALAFPARHPAVVSVVVGARSGPQVLDNLARSRAAIPDELWAELAHEGLVPDHATPTESGEK